MATTQVVNDLQAMPFSAMIGAPLSACIDAQEQAARSSVDFIRKVGFDEEDPSKIVNVNFIYKRKAADGSLTDVEISVPLLTIVPIPFISIDTININFKANLKSVQTELLVETEEEKKQSYDQQTGKYFGLRGFAASKKTSYMSGSVSTKKDSKASQDSAYSVEANIDINVIAHQESMPAGMARVLEILNQAITQTELSTTPKTDTNPDK